MPKWILLGIALLLPLKVSAEALQVFACEPEWAALATQLGGQRVEVFSATTAQQDPHHIDARPSLIARLRQADLLICTGADLEAGWLPLLLRKAANPRVQPGKPGHLLAAEQVNLLDIPQVLDRAHGDVHPAGNPHLHTDPRNIARVAQVLSERLAQLSPDHAAELRQRHAVFARDWDAAIQRWEARAEPLRGLPVVVQHKSWVYLNAWLGLREVAVLEPNPGIPPTTAFLAGVVERLREQPARLVLYAAYQDPRPSQWLAAQMPISVVELPYTVGGDAADLFALFDLTLERLLAGLEP